MSTEIHGRVHPKFERVKDAFAQEFAAGNEVGASLCLTLEGESVVDLWAGSMDGARTRPWQRDTLANVYSTTKGITAIAAHRLVDEGLLDLDAPVARYWPEFAQNGKERLPVRWLLSHQAGLCAVAKRIPVETLYDWVLRIPFREHPNWRLLVPYVALYVSSSYGFVVMVWRESVPGGLLMLTLTFAQLAANAATHPRSPARSGADSTTRRVDGPDASQRG